MTRSGYTLTASASPEGWLTRARPSGPTLALATPGSAWRPRRRGTSEPAKCSTPVSRSSASAGMAGWRSITRRRSRAVAVTSIGVATPLESTGASARSTTGGSRTDHASAPAEAITAITPATATHTGTTSAASAIAAMIAAVRIVGAAANSPISAGRERRRSRPESRRRRRTARARPQA
jgi:hypothetical protein